MNPPPAAGRPASAAEIICPECGGRLSEPISGPIHCFRRCVSCGAEYQMDDPELL